ncbi:hypothetical protein SAMN05444271_11932 [Halohasta litchfieldiae]|uniref:Uncharacterized protein n=1 Tax=Halohasta litchfieldiae TaxID=1073996 RepID=A0A1H6VR48_9EURY|nr:hypothetical protein SAMN05444271_11932 [Halohasta litchfieldiae]
MKVGRKIFITAFPVCIGKIIIEPLRIKKVSIYRSGRVLALAVYYPPIPRFCCRNTINENRSCVYSCPPYRFIRETINDDQYN